MQDCDSSSILNKISESTRQDKNCGQTADSRPWLGHLARCSDALPGRADLPGITRLSSGSDVWAAKRSLPNAKVPFAGRWSLFINPIHLSQAVACSDERSRL